MRLLFIYDEPGKLIYVDFAPENKKENVSPSEADDLINGWNEEAGYEAFRIVETVKRAYKITRDASYSLERHLGKMIINIDIIAVYFQIDSRNGLFGELLLTVRDIRIDLCLRKLSAFNIHIYHNIFLPFIMLCIRCADDLLQTSDIQYIVVSNFLTTKYSISVYIL